MPLLSDKKLDEISKNLKNNKEKPTPNSKKDKELYQVSKPTTKTVNSPSLSGVPGKRNRKKSEIIKSKKNVKKLKERENLKIFLDLWTYS